MNEDKKEEKQDTSVATLEEATMPPKQPNQIPEESGGADGDVTTKTEESTNSSFPQTPPAEPKSIPVTQSPSTGKKKAGLKVSIISPKSSDPGEALYPESAIITALEENKGEGINARELLIQYRLTRHPWNWYHYDELRDVKKIRAQSLLYQYPSYFSQFSYADSDVGFTLIRATCHLNNKPLPSTDLVDANAIEEVTRSLTTNNNIVVMPLSSVVALISNDDLAPLNQLAMERLKQRKPIKYESIFNLPVQQGKKNHFMFQVMICKPPANQDALIEVHEKRLLNFYSKIFPNQSELHSNNIIRKHLKRSYTVSVHGFNSSGTQDQVVAAVTFQLCVKGITLLHIAVQETAPAKEHYGTKTEFMTIGEVKSFRRVKLATFLIRLAQAFSVLTHDSKNVLQSACVGAVVGDSEPEAAQLCDNIGMVVQLNSRKSIFDRNDSLTLQLIADWSEEKRKSAEKVRYFYSNTLVTPKKNRWIFRGTYDKQLAEDGSLSDIRYNWPLNADVCKLPLLERPQHMTDMITSHLFFLGHPRFCYGNPKSLAVPPLGHKEGRSIITMIGQGLRSVQNASTGSNTAWIDASTMDALLKLALRDHDSYFAKQFFLMSAEWSYPLFRFYQEGFASAITGQSYRWVMFYFHKVAIENPDILSKRAVIMPISDGGNHWVCNIAWNPWARLISGLKGNWNMSKNNREHAKEGGRYIHGITHYDPYDSSQNCGQRAQRHCGPLIFLLNVCAHYRTLRVKGHLGKMKKNQIEQLKRDIYRIGSCGPFGFAFHPDHLAYDPTFSRACRMFQMPYLQLTNEKRLNKQTDGVNCGLFVVLFVYDVLVTQYNTILNASMIPGGNAKSILQLIAEGNNKMVMPSVYRIGEGFMPYSDGGGERPTALSLVTWLRYEIKILSERALVVRTAAEYDGIMNLNPISLGCFEPDVLARVFGKNNQVVKSMRNHIHCVSTYAAVNHFSSANDNQFGMIVWYKQCKWPMISDLFEWVKLLEAWNVDEEMAKRLKQRMSDIVQKGDEFIEHSQAVAQSVDTERHNAWTAFEEINDEKDEGYKQKEDRFGKEWDAKKASALKDASNHLRNQRKEIRQDDDTDDKDDNRALDGKGGAGGDNRALDGKGGAGGDASDTSFEDDLSEDDDANDGDDSKKTDGVASNPDNNNAKKTDDSSSGQPVQDDQNQNADGNQQPDNQGGQAVGLGLDNDDLVNMLQASMRVKEDGMVAEFVGDQEKEFSHRPKRKQPKPDKPEPRYADGSVKKKTVAQRQAGDVKVETHNVCSDPSNSYKMNLYLGRNRRSPQKHEADMRAAFEAASAASMKRDKAYLEKTYGGRRRPPPKKMVFGKFRKEELPYTSEVYPSKVCKNFLRRDFGETVNRVSHQAYIRGDTTSDNADSDAWLEFQEDYGQAVLATKERMAVPTTPAEMTARCAELTDNQSIDIYGDYCLSTETKQKIHIEACTLLRDGIKGIRFEPLESKNMADDTIKGQWHVLADLSGGRRNRAENQVDIEVEADWIEENFHHDALRLAQEHAFDLKPRTVETVDRDGSTRTLDVSGFTTILQEEGTFVHNNADQVSSVMYVPEKQTKKRLKNNKLKTVTTPEQWLGLIVQRNSDNQIVEKRVILESDWMDENFTPAFIDKLKQWGTAAANGQQSQFISIPAGDDKPEYDTIVTNQLAVRPTKWNMFHQKEGEQGCLLRAAASVFLSMGKQALANELGSLAEAKEDKHHDWDKLKKTVRKHLPHHQLQGLNCQFDVLSEHDNEKYEGMVFVLHGNDGGTTHAVGCSKGVVYDANIEKGMRMCRETLDHCCSGPQRKCKFLGITRGVAVIDRSSKKKGKKEKKTKKDR